MLRRKTKEIAPTYPQSTLTGPDDLLFADWIQGIVDAERKPMPRDLIYVASGHGGNDPGAVGNGLIERDLNKSIVIETVRELRARGFKVATDLDKNNPRHPGQVTDAKSHLNLGLYLEVHHNAGGGRGAEIYCDGRSESAGRILELVVGAIRSSFNPSFLSRGAKQAGSHQGAVLSVDSANHPAYLLEVLFLDSADASIPFRPHYARIVGLAIAQGLDREARLHGIQPAPPVTKTRKEWCLQDDNGNVLAYGTLRHDNAYIAAPGSASWPRQEYGRNLHIYWREVHV